MNRALRPYAVYIAELSVTLVEELCDVVLGSAFPEDASERKMYGLTIYGLTLLAQHARGAVAEFDANRSYSGAALCRCLYETIVRLIDWHLDKEQALKEWAALPISAYKEEKRKVDDVAKVPAGVQRHYDAYIAEHPELADVDAGKTRAAAERVFKDALHQTEAEFRRDYGIFYGVGSLFVHARPLGLEDLFDVSVPGEWSLRETSLIAEPNARVLAMATLLALVAHFVALKYSISTEPVDRFMLEFARACKDHDATHAEKEKIE